MKICQVGSEMIPYSKTGGLADVVGSLPVYLSRMGHEVVSVLPLYMEVDRGKLRPDENSPALCVRLGDRSIGCAIKVRDEGSGRKTYFIEHDDFFNRPGLYGNHSGDFSDNALRFTFFSKAVLELLKAIDFRPDIIHCHDWQTGLVPAYMKSVYVLDPFFRETASLFTLHNAAYQGNFPAPAMHLTGIDYGHFNHLGLEFRGGLCFLKAGIVYADLLSTVSERYAQEIQSPEYGMGLEGIYRQRRTELRGILNGVDYDIWNPETDRHIARNYSATDLAGKAVCKKDLQRSMGLPDDENAPVVAMVTRLAWQKGFDIVESVIESFVTRHGMQMVFLGEGEARYEKRLQALRDRYPDRIGVFIGFNEPLAHKIEAGADLFVMSSRYEPCGLNQIYSLRYGTLPVVRATGGLDDTIDNYDAEHNFGNGFKFWDLSGASLYQTVMWALDVYWTKKDAWRQMIMRAMATRFTWERAAGQYVEYYERALKKRRPERIK